MAKTFKVIFIGRLIGTGPLAECATFLEYVKAKNKEAAMRQIYSKYEHVSKPQIKAWKQDPDNYGAGRPSGM